MRISVNKLKGVLFSVFCFLVTLNSFGQQRGNFNKSIPNTSATVKALLEVKTPEQNKNQKTAFSGKGIRAHTFFAVLFLGYKTFLSSQDVPDRCGFTPSCSEYGLYATRKHGAIKGIIHTFDRLSRCNGYLDKSGYPYDDPTGKYIDDP